ncbi:MAG TPA: hypothetical protein VK195_10200 [Burkholderiaceae bacterium]|nr:hypothetical protein [Burkholderiaceae bacterium]
MKKEDVLSDRTRARRPLLLAAIGASALLVSWCAFHRAKPTELLPEFGPKAPMTHARPDALPDMPGTSVAPSTPLAEVSRNQGIPDKVLALIPWDRYPSGLGTAAGQALQTGDGERAASIANDLGVCVGIQSSLQSLQASLNQTSNLGSRQILQQQWKVRQQDASYCQAVPGDINVLRAKLLSLAVDQGVDGAGTDLALLGGRAQENVMRQVLKDMEGGHARALNLVADGLIAAASPLQVAAARDAVVRGASDKDLQGTTGPELEKDLDFMQRHATVDAWKADPQNSAKLYAARTVWSDEHGGTRLAPSADPQVRALADKYLAALKKRKAAQGS